MKCPLCLKPGRIEYISSAQDSATEGGRVDLTISHFSTDGPGTICVSPLHTEADFLKRWCDTTDKGRYHEALSEIYMTGDTHSADIAAKAIGFTPRPRI